MTDYVEREAAIKEMLSRFFDGKETLRAIMESIPPAEVAHIVHCGDCVHGHSQLCQSVWCAEMNKWILTTGYCYLGRRKENEDAQCAIAGM